MSFKLPTERKVTAYRSRWSGAAFLIEAMLLLVFVMASLAVVTQLFAASAERASQSKALTDAVAIATTTAERFSANPASVDSEFEYEDMRIVCDIRPEKRANGTMWQADIKVYPRDAAALNWASTSAGREMGFAGAEDNPTGIEPLYTVSTSVYKSGV